MCKQKLSNANRNGNSNGNNKTFRKNVTTEQNKNQQNRENIFLKERSKANEIEAKKFCSNIVRILLHWLDPEDKVMCIAIHIHLFLHLFT